MPSLTVQKKPLSDRVKYSKYPHRRTKVLRIVSLKFHYSFRVKLFMYRLFERTLSMAESTLLQLRFCPLNADNESLAE